MPYKLCKAFFIFHLHVLYLYRPDGTLFFSAAKARGYWLR